MPIHAGQPVSSVRCVGMITAAFLDLSDQYPPQLSLGAIHLVVQLDGGERDPFPGLPGVGVVVTTHALPVGQCPLELRERIRVVERYSEVTSLAGSAPAWSRS